VGTSTPEPHLSDRSSTDSTGLVGTIVNPRHASIITVCTLDIEIITKGSAALVDRGLEDFDSGLAQQFDLGNRELVCGSIGVNVAHK
jgi:hypothetical protein